MLEALFITIRLKDGCFLVKFETFLGTYFEEHLRTTASEFVGDTTVFHETILKKHTNGKNNIQGDEEYNWKQHFE